MLPRALRGSFVEESINMAIVECEIRIALFFFFQFLQGSSGIKERIWVEDSTAGAKRNKESLVSFSGDDLVREENELKFTRAYKNRP